MVHLQNIMALQNCENYLSGFYSDEKLDICCSAFDGFAYGIKAALEAAGYTEDKFFVIILIQRLGLAQIRRHDHLSVVIGFCVVNFDERTVRNLSIRHIHRRYRV